jgi:hypothetical protein
MRSIIDVISAVELAVRSASLRTSSATTAKAPSRFAGTRCFDGGIEGEQVGLVGDLANDPDNHRDLAGQPSPGCALTGRCD